MATPYTFTLTPEHVKAVYAASLKLWQSSFVERHGEGHPGIPGPAGDASEPWDETEATLRGAINTLTLIHERIYGEQTKTQ